MILSVLLLTSAVLVLAISILTDSWSAGHTISSQIQGHIKWGLWKECKNLSIGTLNIGNCKNLRVSPNKKQVLLACRVLAISVCGVLIIAGIAGFMKYKKLFIGLVCVSFVMGVVCLVLWAKNMLSVGGIDNGVGYSYILYCMGLLVAVSSIIPEIFFKDRIFSSPE